MRYPVLAHTALKHTLTHHEDTFPSHPSDRKHRPPLNPVVISGIQVSAHAEVSDLNVPLSSSVLCLPPLSPNQAVTRGQVSVHKIKRCQELHTRCNLTRHGNEGRVAEAQNTGKLTYTLHHNPNKTSVLFIHCT